MPAFRSPVMSDVKPPDGIELPPEPTTLKRKARSQALTQPDRWLALASDGTWLADWLWSQWGEILQARGLTDQVLKRIIASYRQELWFWLLGERTWTQTIEGLAGRVRRRSMSYNSTSFEKRTREDD